MYGLKVVEEWTGLEPRHIFACLYDIIPSEGRHWYKVDVVDIKPSRECRVIQAYLVKDLFIVIYNVHLIDGHHYMLYSEEGAYEGVPLGLRKNAVAGINQDNCQIAGGCAGGHVSGILLVTWCVGYDKLAFFRWEI